MATTQLRNDHFAVYNAGFGATTAGAVEAVGLKLGSNAALQIS
jgi:hypothetical protein